MIGLHDRDGIITYVSPSTTRWLGYSAGDLVGRPTFDVVHPDDRERITGLFSELIDRPGRTFIAEYRLRRADGSWHWIEGTATNLLEEPDVRAVVVNYHDVTKRVRAQEALRESQRALTALLANLPGMVYRCRLDADWTMEFVSQGCAELTGYQPADLIDNSRADHERRA